MTFIASVVARDGVAIIADSLVTASRHVIDLEDFLEYVESKNLDGAQIQLDVTELYDLFESQDSYTRDFEEKIFEYDAFTALTTAGNAQINEMRIRQLVAKKKAINQENQDFSNWTIQEKVNDFCQFVRSEIKNYTERNELSIVGETVFLFTHFDDKAPETLIFKITTVECSSEDFKDPGFDPVPVPSKQENAKIVCDGQNRISNGILYGGIETVIKSVNKTIEVLSESYGYDSNLVDNEGRRKIFRECIDLIDEDIQLRKMSELSLQQAVDLAALLMRIEIDFQKYTSNIPTVGGLVKIATINSKGFQFVSGHEITTPKLM